MEVRLSGDRRGGTVTIGPFARVGFRVDAGTGALVAVGHQPSGVQEPIATWLEHEQHWWPANPKALGPYDHLDLLPTQGA